VTEGDRDPGTSNNLRVARARRSAPRWGRGAGGGAAGVVGRCGRRVQADRMEPVPADEGDAGVTGASATYALEGDGAWIARARGLAAAFLARAAEAADGLAVSARAVEVTQL